MISYDSSDEFLTGTADDLLAHLRTKLTGALEWYEIASTPEAALVDPRVADLVSRGLVRYRMVIMREPAFWWEECKVTP